MQDSSLSVIIGKRIRKLRTEQGLSQEALAHKAALHPTYIGQLERGEKNATLETINKIAKALEIDLHHLFNLSESSHKEQTDQLDMLRNKLSEVSEKDKSIILQIIGVLMEWKNSDN